MRQPPCCLRCGCPHDAHQHYTRATTCALCSCPRYQRWLTPADVLWTMWAVVGLWRRL